MGEMEIGGGGIWFKCKTCNILVKSKSALVNHLEERHRFLIKNDFQKNGVVSRGGRSSSRNNNNSNHNNDRMKKNTENLVQIDQQYEKITIPTVRVVLNQWKMTSKKVSNVTKLPLLPITASNVPISTSKKASTSSSPSPPSSTKKRHVTPNSKNTKSPRKTHRDDKSSSPEPDPYTTSRVLSKDDLIFHPSYFPYVCHFCPSQNCKSCESLSKSKKK